MSTYAGKIIGKPGNIVTTDASTTNGKPDGASISFGGIITAGYGTDGSVSVGIGAFGYESHVGVGKGKGLGQISVGASYTKGSEVNGFDVKFKGGGVTAAAATAAFVIATGGWGILAL